MNFRTLVRVLLLIGPLVTLTAAPSVLMSCDEARDDEQGRTVFTGHARAMFQGANAMTISATSITHDFRKHSLLCQGDVSIVCGGQTIMGKELTIDLGSQGVNMYRLDSNGIVIENGKTGSSGATSEPLRQATPFVVPAEVRPPQK
jgi:hypothetical protein